MFSLEIDQWNIEGSDNDLLFEKRFQLKSDLAEKRIINFLKNFFLAENAEIETYQENGKHTKVDVHLRWNVVFIESVFRKSLLNFLKYSRQNQRKK